MTAQVARLCDWLAGTEPCAWHGVPFTLIELDERGVLLHGRAEPTGYAVVHIAGFDGSASPAALTDLSTAAVQTTHGCSRVELCARGCDADAVMMVSARLIADGRIVAAARSSTDRRSVVPWQTERMRKAWAAGQRRTQDDSELTTIRGAQTWACDS